MSENDAGWGGDAPAPVQAPGAYGKASGPRATFWQRFAAGFIDGLVVGVVGVVPLSVEL